MNVHIRLTHSAYDTMQVDLRRPHPFAGERVGFLYGRLAQAGPGRLLILMTAYVPLGDERYLTDPKVGARIDSAAIRSAMQGVIDRNEGVFHTHLHAWPGRPGFSRTDLAELPRLVSSFQTVGRDHAHGLFLLSDDQGYAQVWLPGQKTPAGASRINIVGFPVSLIEGQV
jgi:hypothetical protein